MGGIVDCGLHREFRSDGGKACAQCLGALPVLVLKADAHEETPRFQIVELGRVGDIATVPGQKPGNRRDNAAPVLRGFLDLLRTS